MTDDKWKNYLMYFKKNRCWLINVIITNVKL